MPVLHPLLPTALILLEPRTAVLHQPHRDITLTLLHHHPEVPVSPGIGRMNGIMRRHSVIFTKVVGDSADEADTDVDHEQPATMSTVVIALARLRQVVPRALALARILLVLAPKEKPEKRK